MTWEEACAYVDTNIQQECARRGIGVDIADPEILALSVNLLLVGKHRHDSLRVEEPPARPARRKNTNRPHVRTH